MHASQLFLFQLQVMGRHPPSPLGLVVGQDYASSFDTYYICANGRVTFDAYYYDQETHGSWSLEGHVLNIKYTRKTGQRGVGNPIPGPGDNLERYAKYVSYDEPTSGEDRLDLDAVLKGEDNYELRDKEPSLPCGP